jgi:hypothetical protein
LARMQPASNRVAETGPFRWDFDAPIGEPIQWFTTKFPTQRNREFSNVYQGKFFKEQGIFMPDASILNFEQPHPTLQEPHLRSALDKRGGAPRALAARDEVDGARSPALLR